ncbi:HNH endonuclease family protein [Cyclobacterium plantarum]|uniref:HNH endonuclease n=1 Tax=Cyclobacterium plantarum TaxID=2716263 RepID=A0ABX0H711_9BACT|nr:HNH endonuclease family protein [Cyclobacterium plantarum]NHE57568.1 HNH endonuclease [Cyclobacterium plantarum]
MLHVWLSKYDYTTKKSLFKKLKGTIKPKNSKEFLNGLVKDSETYISIFDSELRKWSKNEAELRDSIEALSNFGVTQQTPMVLSIMRDYNAQNLKYKYTREGLNSIEKFHYVFTAITSQRSSGGIASMYSTFARKLTACKSDQDQLAVIRELQLKMKGKLPTYDEFLANFKNLKYTNKFTKHKKTIQYTLKQIDKYFNGNGVPIDYELMTIEHILAQNPNSKAPNHDSFVGRIGNLVYIDNKTNGGLENKNFEAKKPILLNASIYIDNILNDANEWNENEINERTEKLAELAFNHVFKI